MNAELTTEATDEMDLDASLEIEDADLDALLETDEADFDAPEARLDTDP